MNTAHIVLRVLIVTWSVLFVVMGTLLVLYLIQRRLDRHDDWVLWEDDLASPSTTGHTRGIAIDVNQVQTAPYDWEQRIEDGL